MVRAATNALRRGLLYVPGSSAKMLEKSRGVKVDTVCYDLEDAVEPGAKAKARTSILQVLNAAPKPQNIKEQSIRINSVDTGLALDDLSVVLKAKRLDAIVIPKVRSAADVTFIGNAIDHLDNVKRRIKIIALIESARALLNIKDICTADSRVDGLIFAAEDYAADVGLQRSPSLTEMLLARQMLATAAAAFDLSAIDLVCTDYTNSERLKWECDDGAALGMTGKQLIHPLQVELCQKAFSPAEDKVRWAVQIIAKNEEASAQGMGAFSFEGKMIDAPVVLLAKSILKQAEAADFDLQELRSKLDL